MNAIVIILLRLFALKNFYIAVNVVVGIFLGGSRSGLNIYLSTVAFYLIAGIGIWILAPWIAGIVVKGLDMSFQTSSITLCDLHRLVFVGVGLYLIGISIGQTFNIVHQIVFERMARVQISNSINDVNRFFQYAAELAVGFIAVLQSRRLSERLCGVKRQA